MTSSRSVKRAERPQAPSDGRESGGHGAKSAATQERAIMGQTGHRSVTMVRRYIREASVSTDNAAGGLL